MIKKKLVMLGMAGVLAVAGVGGSPYFTSDKMIVKAQEKIVYLSKNVTIGKGEEVTDVSNIGVYLELQERDTKADDGSKKIITPGYNSFKGKATGKCKLYHYDVMTGGEIKNASGTYYLNVKVKKAPKYVEFDKSTITIKVGKSISKPSYELSPGSASRQKNWTIGDTSIVQWSAGKLKALKAGTTKVTLSTFNGKSDSVTIKVKK